MNISLMCTHLASIEDADVNIAALAPPRNGGARTDFQTLCKLSDTELEGKLR